MNSTAKAPAEPPVVLEIYSDTICPWCLIAKDRLDKAVSEMEGGDRVTFHWRAFELNPTMPPEGMSRREYRSAKFGSWEYSQKLDEEVTAAGKETGIVFRHDLMQFTPNTRASHRLVWWAREGNQHGLVERLLRGYFCEGRDVGSLGVLAEIAGESGFDAEAALEFLGSDEGLDEVIKEESAARKARISGVPAILHEGRPVLNGALSIPAIRQKLETLVKGGKVS